MRSQRVYARGFSHVICHGEEGILSPGISGQTVLRETPPPPPGPGKPGGQVYGDWPGGRVRGRKQEMDLSEGVHVDGRGVVSSLAVYLWENRQSGEGLTGRGKGTFPRPCLLCLRLNGIRETPPPPGRSAASSRPLKGAGSEWR